MVPVLDFSFAAPREIQKILFVQFSAQFNIFKSKQGTVAF